MEITGEQLSEAKGEKIPEKTFVYHGTTPESFEKIMTEGIKPGTIKYFIDGKPVGNKDGFSVTTDEPGTIKYGVKTIKFELSPDASIAKPEYFPEIWKRRGGTMTFFLKDAARAAKEAGFDGIALGSHTDEIRIFNPDVLQIVTPEEEKRE